MKLDPASLGDETLLQHLGEEDKVFGAVIPPLFQNSLFVFDTMDEFFQPITEANSPRYHYSRVSNPTVEVAEKKLAMLEHTDGCKLFGSGMGAISAAILHCVKAGSHIVMVDTAYGPARQFASTYLARFGVTTTFVEGTNTEEVIEAIQPETSLVYLETPSSLLFRVQDIPAITEECKKRGVLTAIDNTYCTPLLMRPAELGVDLVIHSATKYLGGHSDLTAGAICANAEHIESISRNEIELLGAMLHPFSAWLLVRGLRTLPLRLKRNAETANTIASWLDEQPEIETVHHIGLPSHPSYVLAHKLMKGPGGLFSFTPKTNDAEKVKGFVDHLKLFGRGVSWGGFESLALAISVKPLDFPDKRWIVRIFCGLEDPQDLLADIQDAIQALR